MPNNHNIYEIYGLFDTTGCRYIGKTSMTLKRRLYYHLRPERLKSKTHHNNWIKKILKSGFEPEIRLLEITTKEQIEWRERVWISFGKNLGWKLTNSTEGGEGSLGRKQSQKTREKIGLFHKGNKWSLGRKQSQEEKDKRALKLKGQKRSKQFCLNMRKLNIGREYPTLQKPVEQWSKDGKITEFKSLSEASKKTKICPSSIGAVCSGKRKSAGNFIWKFKT